MASQASTFWRAAGLSYVAFLNRASTTVRAGLKEPLRAAAEGRGVVSYNRSLWENQVATKPEWVESMAEAAARTG